MTEIELLKREFDAVPAPEEGTAAAARAALLRDIAAESPRSRAWSRRGWIRLAVAAGAVVLLAGVLTAVIPHTDRLTGPRDRRRRLPGGNARRRSHLAPGHPDDTDTARRSRA